MPRRPKSAPTVEMSQGSDTTLISGDLDMCSGITSIGDITISLDSSLTTSPYITGMNSMSGQFSTDTISITESPWIISSPIQSGVMELNGENADIKINGRSLCEAIQAIEQRLAILTPNPEVEKEWEELRQLGEQYRALEQKCIEKSKIWNKLKQMPPVVP